MYILSTARKEVGGGMYLVFYYARRFLLEPDLKLMNKPVKSFLHNVNAYGPKVICKLVLIARYPIPLPVQLVSALNVLK